MVQRTEEVRATKIDGIRIYYQCDYCSNPLTKSGRPRKNAKPKYHWHGTGGDDLPSYSRGCHCPNPNAPSDVLIVVDEQTERA